MTGRCGGDATVVVLGRRGAARRARSLARRPRRSRSRARPVHVFPADNVWHLDVSKLPVNARVRRRGSRRCTRSATFLHPDFGPPSYGIPFDVVDAAHADVARATSPTRARAMPGPYPFGPDIARRGRVRPARDHDRSGHLHAVRAVRGAVERRRARRPARGAVFDLDVERAAARGLDERRRRRAADLPRAAALRRGGGRRRSTTRSASRRRAPHDAYHLAGAPRGRARTTGAARRWARASG